MKLKSLFLGSVAAAGLSTGAFAADLNVLTSLDVCDLLGMSGLTISSDTNCLAITGKVNYRIEWGDYNGTALTVASGHDNYTVPDNDQTAANVNMDWDSEMDAFLQFVAASESDFGTAKAVIKFDYDYDSDYNNEAVAASGNTASQSAGLRIEDAYVSVGDSTILMVGQKGSIFKNGDDAPLNFLGLFNSEGVDVGVDTAVSDFYDGGPSAAIQVVSDLGNGLSVGVGAENLDSALGAAPGNTTAGSSGSLVGVVSYAGDNLAAHLSVVGGGFLDGNIEDWAMHAGFTGTFDMVQFVAAVAYDDNNYLDALASAKATFDMFTLAGSVEYVDPSTSVANNEQIGFGASAGAGVTDGVTVNVGFRYYDDNTSTANTESWQTAVQLVAALTETMTVTGELGYFSTNKAAQADPDVLYGAVELAWAPGGDFSSSAKVEVYDSGAYKTTFKAAKTFQ